MKGDRLSERERRFVEAYMGRAGGVGKTAAKLAGYHGNDSVLEVAASRLLRKDKVRAAIDARVEASPEVADRKERQAFWSNVMRGKKVGKVAMKDRLKASELLGRSHADFVDRHEHTGKDGKPLLSPDERVKRIVELTETARARAVKR